MSVHDFQFRFRLFLKEIKAQIIGNRCADLHKLTTSTSLKGMKIVSRILTILNQLNLIQCIVVQKIRPGKSPGH